MESHLLIVPSFDEFILLDAGVDAALNFGSPFDQFSRDGKVLGKTIVFRFQLQELLFVSLFVDLQSGVHLGCCLEGFLLFQIQ